MRKISPKAFTLIELLVVISIVAVLMAILLPSIQKSRDVAMTMKCSASLRAIGLADEAYRNDNRRWFVRLVEFVPLLAEYTGTSPRHYTWYGTNDPRHMQAHPFKCPLIFRGSEFSGTYGNVMVQSVGGVSDYGPNTANHFNTRSLTNVYINHRRDDQLVNAPSLVLNFADTRSGGARMDYSNFSVNFRHNAGALSNILFVDGHVKPIQDPGPGITFNRGFNNTLWYDNRPYFWW